MRDFCASEAETRGAFSFHEVAAAGDTGNSVSNPVHYPMQVSEGQEMIDSTSIEGELEVDPDNATLKRQVAEL